MLELLEEDDAATELAADQSDAFHELLGLLVGGVNGFPHNGNRREGLAKVGVF